MELCEFVACTRPGYDKTGLQKKINELNDNFKARIHFLEIPALSISSTDIRNRLIAGKTIKYLVPQAVEQYIYKFGLYTDDSSNTPQIMEINKKIHSLLTPKRSDITQGVAEEAQKLAKLMEKMNIRLILPDSFTIVQNALHLMNSYNFVKNILWRWTLFYMNSQLLPIVF